MAKQESRLLNIVKQMGFSITELSNVTGYSRQYFHAVSSNVFQPHSNARLGKAVEDVEIALEERFSAEVRELGERYAEQLKALDELKEMLLGTEVGHVQAETN